MGCIIEQYPNTKLWEKLLEIEAEVQSIIEERLVCTQNSPSLAGTGETIRFSVSIIDNDTGPIAEDKIVAGTYDLIRVRDNIETTTVDDGAFSKRDGFIYIDIDFDTATWDLDDSYILIPNQNSTAEIDGTTYHLPLSAWSGMILDLSGLETAINTIITTLGTPVGASISADIAALNADVGNASGSGLGSLYGILGDPAQTFTTMVGYQGATSLANKLTLARAIYLDNINNVNLATIADISTLTAVNIAFLNNINNANLATIPDISTLSIARIGYLDELAAANLPADVQNVYDDSLHSLKFTGTSWFVDGDNGNDANSGITPDLAFQHIANAITAAGVGDRIYVMAATAAYDEDGLNLNDIGLELYCEKGAVLSNSAGGATTTITLSANYTRVSGATFIQAGVSGVNVTGSVCLIDNCLAANCAVGFDIDGFANTIRDCKSNNHTATGFDIYDDSNTLENCIAVGDGSARGFYLSNAAAGNNTFLHCQTANNGTGVGEAGYEVVASADNNIFSFCSMSDGDQKVDAGTNNTWSDFSEGSQIVAGQTRDQDLKDIHDDTTAILADVGNASGSGLGSLYSILGNPAQTFTAMVGYEGATSLASKLTAARAGFLDNIDNANLSTVPDISTLSAARIGYLDELAAANLPADIDDILAEKLEINEVIIYPTAEDSSTTALSDDGTSPAYLTAATHTGDTNWTDAWTEDINFEQAGTISVISIYAEVEFEMKTSDAGATATARLQISGDGGGSWVTVTDELTTTSTAYVEKLRAGTGTWISAITAGANQLQFKLQHKISDGTKIVSTAMRTSTYFRITYRKS
jgi:hypothetical protein